MYTCNRDLKVYDEQIFIVSIRRIQTEANECSLFRGVATFRTRKRVKGGSRGRFVRGAVGRISILLLVYPRQPGSYRATTMSPVMSTVRHCPLLPGESVSVPGRVHGVRQLRDRVLKRQNGAALFSLHYSIFNSFRSVRFFSVCQSLESKIRSSISFYFILIAAPNKLNIKDR